MMKKSTVPKRSLTLRERAEELLQRSRRGIEPTSSDDLKFLLQELQVYQVELEIQNEELRNVQLELEDSRDRYAELYDFAPVGYLTLGRMGLISRANFSAETLLGVDRIKLMGAPFSHFITADSQDTWYFHRQRVLRGVGKEVCEVRAREGDRMLRVESVGREEATEPERMLTVLLDISEIRKMEGEIRRLNEKLQKRVAERTQELTESNEALRERQNRMRAILDAAADAIVTIDEDGNILSFNPAAEGMFEYRADEAIGRSLDTLMRRPDAGWGSLENYLYVRESSPKEFRGLRKSGEVFPAELAVREFADGDSRRFCAIIRDISERRRLEYEIAEISGAEQRRISQDLHDGLGQELTGVSFMAGALAQKLAEKSLPEAREMTEAVRLISDAIEKTRTLARGLCPVNLDRGGLASALHALVVETELRRNVSCVLDCEEALHIDNDNIATNLYYIAREAINNAIRHGRAKTIKIIVTQRSGRIRLTVRDDGLGFPADLQPTEGMGLQIMKYRARTIGGLLTLRAPKDGGTIVICSIVEGMSHA